MKINYRLPLIIALIGYSCCFTAAQDMWPGDANNNGVVNGVDLLYHGLAYGSEGPARTGGTTQWQGQPITVFWGQTFPNGLDYAYADGDGDGEIDDDDKDAIEENFTLTHGVVTPDQYANAAPGSAPRISLVPDATIVQEGALVNVDLLLGDAGMPASNFYGIAFKISYDTDLLADDDGIEFESVDNSWITAGDGDIEELFIPTGTGGTAELAITRTNQQVVSTGSGSIGSFSIIIEDIIVGLTIDTLNLRIDSVLLIDNQLNAFAIVPDSTQIIVAKDPKLVATSQRGESMQPVVFPNPGRGSFFIRSAQPLYGMALRSQLGQPVPIAVQRRNAGLYHLQTADVPPGIYFLSGQGPRSRFTQKIIIQP